MKYHIHIPVFEQLGRAISDNKKTIRSQITSEEPPFSHITLYWGDMDEKLEKTTHHVLQNTQFRRFAIKTQDLAIFPPHILVIKTHSTGAVDIHNTLCDELDKLPQHERFAFTRASYSPHISLATTTKETYPPFPPHTIVAEKILLSKKEKQETEWTHVREYPLS